eukprot:9424_1
MYYNKKLLFPILHNALNNRKKFLALNNKPVTMVDHMLLDKSISDEYILGNSMAMMAGGLKSVTTRLKKAIHHLALFPNIYQRIYNELINVYPNRKFTFNKIKKCHLLRAYIHEIIRTSTLIPLAGGRIVTDKNGINVEGYNILYGSLLMFNCHYMDVKNKFKYP